MLETSMITDKQHLRRVQFVRKAALFAGLLIAVVGLCVTDSIWREKVPFFYEAIEQIGVLLILLCICGRTWSTLYIGARKKSELVTIGPYSIVRNPLYVFTLIGAFGIGAQFASLTAALSMMLGAGAVFRSVVAREEAFLAAAFPAPWQAYAGRVARFMPRPSLWRDTDALTIKPSLVVRTFFDACLFAIAIPAAELIETAQAHGVLPVLALVP